METMREFVSDLMNGAAIIPENYALEDAQADLINFRADELDLPEDATAEGLCAAMQDWLAEYARISDAD